MDEFLSMLPDILVWLENNGRVYPWRETTDPWHVYCSEILLQRTRGDLVANVYDDFFGRFPDAEALYSVADDEIREIIAPLGFGNQRTRTLREVATLVHVEYNGKVPDSEEELKKPWRVGPYSARATLVFAFNRPLSLVDANFARVLSRFFDCELSSQPHKSDSVYRVFDGVVPREPGLARSFNLALLDLGAEICTPSSPDCQACPLSAGCRSSRI
ncbi:hypothetical protein [Halomicrococcus sp. SG-WS-1]|uniref:hypothetical protein n=1 Tax=Halomicrococcus sp. SG-WS-1 TaxID=3439057 RepID=UPI003F79B221